MIHILYDKSLNEYQALDENFNLVNHSMDKENKLYSILSAIVNDDLIDQSLIEEEAPEIYEFLIEKIHLSDNRDNHKMHLFEGTLNYKAKRNLLIAYNKYMVKHLSEILQDEITLDYE